MCIHTYYALQSGLWFKPNESNPPISFTIILYIQRHVSELSKLLRGTHWLVAYYRAFDDGRSSNTVL